MIRSELAGMIDHTLLRPDAGEQDIIRLCNEALHYRFKAVCIAPVWVPTALKALSGTDTRVATVIGFPLGSTLAEVKAFEARMAMEDGAHELDMVIQVGLLRTGDTAAVLRDIRGVVSAAKEFPGSVVKVILETALLTDPEKILGCRLAKEAGADFVKTSTGFAKGGATVEDVSLLRKTAGSHMGVKASGGIRDLRTALAMIDAGANRIGCSASVQIMGELDEP